MPPALPPLEKQIAARLKLAREERLMTRSALARKAGLNVRTLGGHETGRTALGWDAYARLARVLPVNPSWLASGTGAPFAPFSARLLETKIEPGTRFSAAFPVALAQAIDTPTASQGINHPDIIETVSIINEPNAAPLLPASGKPFVFGTPEQNLGQLLEAARAARRHLAALGGEDIPARKELKALIQRIEALLEIQSEQITDSRLRSDAYASNLEPVRKGTQLEALLSRVRKQTSKRGSKSELAKKLGVPRQNISDWVRGYRTPDAASTLRLLELFPADGK